MKLLNARETTRSLPSIVGLIIGVALLIGVQIGKSSAQEKEPETLRDLIDQATQWYQVFPSETASAPSKVITALRWANNSRGSEDGVTVLFVADGRPLAAACIYPWEKHLEHDFESLTTERIVAKREGIVIWKPQEPGIKYADVPGGPKPEATPAGRLRQMKQITQMFSATMLGWKSDSSDREELRLLPRPLYRYETKGGDVIDGALFAFAMGTDPEVLLLIEAVKRGDAEVWRYAFARRTSGELAAKLNGQVVWNAPRFPEQRDPRRPHYNQSTRVSPRYFDVPADQGR